MDVFYEESAVVHNKKKGERKYKILHIFSMIFLILGIILLVLFLLNFPWSIGSLSGVENAEEIKEQYYMGRFLYGFCGMQGAVFMLFWFIFGRIKRRINVSYDYIFVSGELRIAKVFNVNKRKLLTRFDCAEIIQIGDVDNPSYDRFKADPTVKKVVCTQNSETFDDKFFMYILIENYGKKLYVLECRETLLMHILRYAKRTALESDYVMQEKKKKQQQQA